MWLSRISLARVGLCLTVLLAACQPERVTLPAAPTPQIWPIEITPALRWLGPIFQKCAAENPGVALVVHERSAAQPPSVIAGLSFQWGEPKTPAPFRAVLAQEELAVILHPSNPNDSLTWDSLVGLYSTSADRWKAACPACAAGFDGPLQAYTYAAGEDVQAAAAGIPAGPRTRLAPDPEAARQAVAQDPYAIGFVPAHWVDASVKRVKILGTPPGALQKPILASAPAEPQGSQRSWLICVQDQVR